jgi:hypothetical protein
MYGTFTRYMNPDSGPNISQEINKMQCCGFGFATHICTSRVITGILHIFCFGNSGRVSQLANNKYGDAVLFRSVLFST